MGMMFQKGKRLCYDTSKEYENRINELRVEEGYTLRDLAKQIGIKHTSTLWTITQGYIGPIDRRGQVKSWALKLSEILKADLAYIWPREICEIKRGELIETQVLDFTIGAYSFGNNGNRKIDIDKMLSTLTSREEMIIKSRIINEDTLQVIAERENCTRERIRQIEANAIRKLRKSFHPENVTTEKEEDATA